MESDFRSKKSANRTLYCPNKMWDEILKKTKNLLSATTYIKVAIVEKMISEDPENKEYYESLLFLR